MKTKILTLLCVILLTQIEHAFSQLSITSTVTNVQCGGGNDGSAVINVIGGIPPYSYTLIGTTPTTSNVFNSLSAGNYLVFVEDATTPTPLTDAITFTITEPPALIVSTLHINQGCEIEGREAIASGGIPPYLYSEDGINYTSDSLFNLTATTPFGIPYIIYVKDANACISITSGYAIAPLPPVSFFNWIISNVTFFGGSDGKIEDIESQNFGFPFFMYECRAYNILTPFTYINPSYNSSSQTFYFENLPAGTYTVELGTQGLNFADCITSHTVTISQPIPLSVSTEFKNDNRVTITPNPASDKITFSQECNATLTDILGNRRMLKQNTTMVDISSFSPGIYFIELSNTKGDVLKMEKLIVE